MGVRLVNLPEVRQGHARFLREHEQLVDRVTQRGGDVALGHVQHHNTFKRRTGKLQDTTDYRVVKLRGGKLLRITNPQKYADSIDGGARPHVIRARNAPYLHFLGKRGWVRTKSVNHPGNRPYKFIYRATHAAHRVMGQELQQGMTELAKRF
jgi:hypothetical protein